MKDLIRSAEKKKVDSKSRKFYLEIKKPPKHKSNLVFQTTFTQTPRNIKEIILKHWYNLQSDPSLSLGIFKEPPMIT